jgi:DNA-binding response OmpR family regulator
MNPESHEEAVHRPCLIVAHADAGYAALVSRAFRRLGWDAYQARGGPEARRLARLLSPDLLVMATELDGESGWLTCEKLRKELPWMKVFLVSGANGPCDEEFAHFVGAAGVVNEDADIPALVREVNGCDLPAAG